MHGEFGLLSPGKASSHSTALLSSRVFGFEFRLCNHRATSPDDLGNSWWTGRRRVVWSMYLIVWRNEAYMFSLPAFYRFHEIRFLSQPVNKPGIIPGPVFLPNLLEKIDWTYACRLIPPRLHLSVYPSVHEDWFLQVVAFSSIKRRHRELRSHQRWVGQTRWSISGLWIVRTITPNERGHTDLTEDG